MNLKKRELESRMESILNKFEAYLLTEKRVSLNTYQAYIQDIKQLCSYLEGQKLTLQQATLDDLKKFLAYMKQTNNCTARSMARKISSMKVLYGWMHEQSGSTNHAAELRSPKLEKKLPQFLSEKEIQELFEVSNNDTSELGKRNAVMLNLLYVSGVRISELTHLKINQLDLESGTIIIDGKGGKGRIIPIPQPSVVILKNYLNAEHKKFIKQHGATDYLFPIVYGNIIKPISRQSFWGILKQLCQKTTIKRNISPHQLRHSLATHLLKRGADLRSLQLLLGHEHVSTVQIYTHLETGYLRKVYDKKHPRS